MSTTIKKATTDFDKWWIRQLLRTVETICVITEFQPKASHFTNAMIFFQTLMSDHEEEILVHLNAHVDYGNPDVAKAYTLLPLCQAIHKLKDDNKIQDDVYVPAMMADVILSLIALTTADLNTAQLKDKTAWLPKQVRLLYNKIQLRFETNNKEPEWVAAVRTKNEDVAVLGGSQAMADASSRMSGKKAAPGEPGGLKDAKPLKPKVKAKTFDPKTRGLDSLPLKHVDDFDNFDDGKTNKTRLVGTYARFATNSGSRTKTQLHRWCVCDESKAAKNKESATYPGHFVSTQGSSSNSSTHPNQGMDGCSFRKFTLDPDKNKPGSAKGKGKATAAAATSNSSSTYADADLKVAVAHIGHLNNQIEQLGAVRDAEHLKYAKAIELANTQLNLQAQKTNELISAHAKTLRASQLETFNAVAKIDSIRGQCEGFAETMLTKATEGLTPDLDTTWSTFSGVLTSEQLDAARWGESRKKVVGSRSINVFDVNAFQGKETTAPPTPIQHTVYQLTDGKVDAQPTPDGYKAPVHHAKLLIPSGMPRWATAAGKNRKRMRDDDGDDDSDAASSVAHDENDEDDEDEDSE